jgi:hypothetical protein
MAPSLASADQADDNKTQDEEETEMRRTIDLLTTASFIAAQLAIVAPAAAAPGDR